MHMDDYEFGLPPASRIAISGASGLLGSHLARHLEQKGHSVYRLVRSHRNPGARTIYWNYERREIETDKLDGLNAVVHLAGANILNWPWTSKKKQTILDSRALGTAFLCNALSKLDNPPGIFLTASGISYYGDQASEWVDESSLIDPRSFLAEVCRQWEGAVHQANLPATRIGFLRIGIVLDSQSLIMKNVTPLFSLGLGAQLWPANPYISWISLQDTIQSIYHVLGSHSLQGPINIVAPNPESQHQFARKLAEALSRPLWLRVPSLFVRMATGELGQETVLTSTRVHPTRLLDSGYSFTHSMLDGYFATLFSGKRVQKPTPPPDVKETS